MEAIHIENEAMVLPEAERAVLADRLLGSLESKKIAFEADLLEESKERFEAYKAGQLQSVDGEKTVADIRASLRK